MGRAHYLLDNQQEEAGERFDALGALFNPSTFRHIEQIGFSSGWDVWEVGAGGPSIPRWLAAQTDGLVLATDIDTAWLEQADEQFVVRTHDIGVDPPPAERFDLVHARLVLVHVPERLHAIETMLAAVKPGGWLLLEEADPGLQPLVCPDESGPAQQLANKLKLAFRSVMAERGVDLNFGRTLPRLLRHAGLVDVGADSYFPLGGPACNELERATIEQIRESLLSAGLATSDEVDRHLENVVSGTLDLATSPMVSAWGRTVSSTDG